MDTVPSLSDIKAVTSGSDGFGGGNGSWWIIILFLFIFAGWGGRGFGGSTGGVTDGYILNSDFSQISRQISDTTNMLERRTDNIVNGICNLGYNEAQLINGLQMSTMQGNNAIQSQLAQCCCDNREAIAGVNYNLATQSNAVQNAVNSGFCTTNYNNATNTRDIIDTQNSGTRAILEAINKMNMDAKDNKIAELTSQINALQLRASQEAQNNYLVSQLGQKLPIPAYTVNNPYCNCNNCNNCIA